MTNIQITDISRILDIGGYYGDYAADFDVDTILGEYVAALDQAAGPDIWVTRSGQVYAALDAAERARQIPWQELAEEIDLEQIARRHEIKADR